MKRFVHLGALVATVMGLVTLCTSGCKTDSGSKEYIPGKGWKNAALDLSNAEPEVAKELIVMPQDNP